jgi:predicted DNA-binding transcriptional regulator YafY
MMGYDLEQSKVKTYYINNIEKLSILDESYLNEAKVQELTKLSVSMVSPWFNNEQKSVLLKVTGDAKLYLKRKRTEAFKIEEEHEDFLSIRLFYYNNVELLNFVKKWIPFIIIVDDEQLKQKLQKMLQEYLSVL